jgi:hypothetical protein
MIKRLTNLWTLPMDLHEARMENERLRGLVHEAHQEQGRLRYASAAMNEDSTILIADAHHAQALLQAEVDRLVNLGIEAAERSPLHAVNIEEGAVEVVIQPPHWALRAMAASFLETLGEAPNWRAIEVGPINSDGGMLIATVCRASGESPVETVGKLKVCIEELLGCVEVELWGRTIDDDVAAVIRRARALLNPEKKD